MTDLIYPRFTLSLRDVPTEEEWGRSAATRTAWVLNSTAENWVPSQAPRGNVNKLDMIEWAKTWAADLISENTSYEVAGWIDPEEGDTEPFWAPRLVHVFHSFRIADIEGEVYEYTADTRYDAHAVQACLIRGEAFIKLKNTKGEDTYINTRHITVARYRAERIEVPL